MDTSNLKENGKSKATYRNSLIRWCLHTKAKDTKQGVGSSGIPPQGAGDTSKPMDSEESTRGRYLQQKET
jgi:hypothetical protein